MLDTDSILIKALSSDEKLMNAIGGNLYDTSIPVPDEELINAPVPYIIVHFDGMRQNTGTKDDFQFEADDDINTVTVEMTAASREQLADIASSVRRTVRAYISDEETGVTDYAVTASAVNYDADKPCYFQNLTYQLITPNE